MVFFTCQHCGESLKKSAVEKHYNQKCRKPPFLTCVDCLKDFKGIEYNKHVDCLTEMEKYSAKGFVPKPPTNKQKLKHLQWIDMIHEVLRSENLTPPQRKLLDACIRHDNIPMKKQKFNNFVKNIIHQKKDTQIIDSVFDLLQSKFKQNLEQAKNVSNESVKQEIKVKNVTGFVENGDQNNDEKPVKVKKSVEVDVSNENDVNLLTKKERKRKRKQEKYLGELNSIECDFEDNGGLQVTDDYPIKTEKIKKKAKKNIITMEAVEGIEQNIDKGSSKKRHKKQIIENAESSTKKLKKLTITNEIEKEDKLFTNGDEIEGKEDQMTNDLELPPRKRFSWGDTIIKILQTQKNNQLPLKRLSKKVISEYQIVKQGHESYEQLQAKFNKKVKKTVGVRVLKERAKLIC